MTLDADVAAKLRALARERGVSFKVALNDAVRAGIGGATGSPRPFRVRAKPLGIRPGVDVDKALRQTLTETTRSPSAATEALCGTPPGITASRPGPSGVVRPSTTKSTVPPSAM